MEGRQMGLLFRKGWFTRRIVSTVGLLLIADAIVKYEYGIPVYPDFSSSRWRWWYENQTQE